MAGATFCAITSLKLRRYTPADVCVCVCVRACVCVRVRVCVCDYVCECTFMRE